METTGISGNTGAGKARPESAVIVIIGDEILSGDVQDVNSCFLAGGLTRLGIRVDQIRVVADGMEAIVDALGDAMRTDGLIMVSGGIGPTHDDLTRQAVAEVLGVPCRRHPGAERMLRDGYGDSITEAELSMADLPEGSELLPGLRTAVHGFRVAQMHVMPGVPHLLQDIFERLAEEWGGSALEKVEILTDLREGHAADALRRIQADWPDVSIGSYPYLDGERYKLRIVLHAASRDSLEQVRALVEEFIASAI